MTAATDIVLSLTEPPSWKIEAWGNGSKPLSPEGFSQSMGQSLDVNSGFLPPMLRFLSRNNGIYIFERPPMHMNMDIVYMPSKSNYDEDAIAHYTLPIPWTVYFVVMNTNSWVPFKVYLFFNREQLDFTKPQRLYLPPVFNIYQTYDFCLPPHDESEYPCEDLQQSMTYVYNVIWSTIFNKDLIHRLAAIPGYYLRELYTGSNSDASIIAFYKRWSKLSLIESCNLDYEPAMRRSFRPPPLDETPVNSNDQLTSVHLANIADSIAINPSRFDASLVMNLSKVK